MHHGVISGLYMYLNKPNLGLNIEDLANAAEFQTTFFFTKKNVFVKIMWIQLRTRV